MRIRMYGTRGIVPSPGWDTKKYGGNTPCIGLRLEDMNDLVIIDAGTGIIKLGQDLVNQGTNYHIRLFLTHIHMDHIQGLPLFLPLYDPKNHITIYSPRYSQVSLEKIFKILSHEHVNPVHLGNPRAKISYEFIESNGIKIKTLRVKTCRMNHPILTMGLRFEHRNRVVTIASDHEPLENIRLEKKDLNYTLTDIDYCSFIDNSDLLIADGQYLPDEVKLYRGWGHANLNYIINQAIISNIKKLVITHHDPNRTDLQIDTILEHYRSLLLKKNVPMELIAAKEVEEYVV